MASAPVVFDGVWKKFSRGEQYDSLRDFIPGVIRRLVRGAPPEEDLQGREFWALQDVSFEVQAGQALGIIGSNGAGKSTALKLLTRIMKPTRGRCEVGGRIGALIEIAAGFHPDLTGRENLFLQGSVMGMRRADTARKFDEIVEFAGLAEFIDTPVKRYSSGMNARLGFSIAAHLDPDVLVVDEVLAVGDFMFQARAFERIRAIARRGTPVVVVSHQLDRIGSLCTHGLLLHQGRVACAGTPEECIGHYVASGQLRSESDGPAEVELHTLDLLSPPVVVSGRRVRLRAEGTIVADDVRHLEPFNVRVRSLRTGEVLFATSNGRCGVALAAGSDFVLDVELQMNVQPGLYSIETVVWDRKQERDVVFGPSVTLEVGEADTSFWGPVQMNPAIRAIPPAARARGGSATGITGTPERGGADPDGDRAARPLVTQRGNIG